jgi:prophage DNA circulation protein
MSRYRAAIDGYEFDCETLDDSFRNAIACYRYPYRDGAETEHMGQEERVIRIRAFWLEELYGGHFAFLEHLKSRELFELSHPVYGLVTGRVEQVDVRHDDRQETAEADISFIQDLASQETAVFSREVQAEAEEEYITGQTELQNSFSETTRLALGAEAGAVLALELDPEAGILEQITGITTAARTWLKTVETWVTTLQTQAAAVANPANSLIAMIDYGSQLPGRVIGTLARTAERYALLSASLRGAPARYLRNLNTSLDDLAAASGAFAGHTRVAGAQRLGLEAATLYHQDEGARDGQRRREAAGSAFDILGNYSAPEPVAAVMTVRELEQSLADVRGAIQAAVDADRSQQALKSMARQLLEHVATVKLERERIVRIELPNPMPLQMVCLMRGLPQAWAERILAINAIRKPNFTAGEIDVYVR